MKTLFPFLMTAVLLLTLGCKEGTPGGPGVAKTSGTSSATNSTGSSSATTSPDTAGSTSTDPATTETTPPAATSDATKNPLVSDPENSFRLDTPNLGVTVKQGESQEVTIAISRAKNFEEDVTLEFGELPKGITIEPAAPVIKASEKDVKLTVKAEPDAALNDFTIKLIGHPTKGADATNELKLTVAKP